MRQRLITVVVIGLLLLGACGLYASPYVAVSGLKAAAEAKNIEQLNQFVDFPVLRDNMKADLRAYLLKDRPQSSSQDKSKVLEALGQALADKLISPMVDAMMTPESLVLILRGRSLQKHGEPSQPIDADVNTSGHYESWDRFVLTVHAKESKDAPVDLIFYRHGLLGWRLSAVNLNLPLM